MVEAYVENVGEKLLDRAYYLNPYMNIKYAFETGEIDFDTVQDCLTLLALGNSDWATHNIEHFKHDTSPVKNGTPFLDFFGWAYSDPYEEFEGIELGETQVLYSGKELKFALAERRKKELKKLKKAGKKVEEEVNHQLLYLRYDVVEYSKNILSFAYLIWKKILV